MVEDAIYTDDRVLEVAAVGVPDKRLGELVAVVVVPKEQSFGEVTEESIIRLARDQCVGRLVESGICHSGILQVARVRCSGHGAHRTDVAWYENHAFPKPSS